jgi:hypothetical protein
MSVIEETKKELSPEEIKAMQDKMDKFYGERIPFLEKQCKYEELTSRIEVARFNRNEAMFKGAQLAMHIQGNKPVEKQPETQL